MAKRHKYSGTLATPIDPPKLLLEDDLDKRLNEEIPKKLGALVDHYQIDRKLPADRIFCQLALWLAFAHVPGFCFSSPRKGGAKPKWTLDECRALVDIIHANKTQKGRLKAAITKAMKRPEWRWSRDIHDFPSTETRYHEAVRTIQRFELMRNPLKEEAVAALMACYGPSSKRSSSKRTTKTPG